jgi:hypothetical protein
LGSRIQDQFFFGDQMAFLGFRQNCELIGFVEKLQLLYGLRLELESNNP